MRLVKKIAVTLVVLLVPLGIMSFKYSEIKNDKVAYIMDELKDTKFSQTISQTIDNIKDMKLSDITDGIDIEGTVNKIKESEVAKGITDYIGNAVDKIETMNIADMFN
ncbi:hypothetical protein QOZ84_01280 [Romboutsia sedimentorum]|uniref:Uncharacterized protein n=1 Tax=Romboutsia sedimentorum TaxID=1368474 RepID=A0ABT7E5G7_9FIRM|nr:hypothetical protein [Romboutsia sedimentorum]MDK2562164.1 hypothetical protein [Romboutsia sedimentorum]MDK2584401.1 hypothetical protein [Romboutsia sedimentorum]